MKKLLTKIKLGFSTLWIAIISFSSKVMGKLSTWRTVWDSQRNEPIYDKSVQAAYWVPNPTNYINPILNAFKWALTVAILIIWIINLIRIIRTDDKDLKKKRIKNTIIIIAILAAILAITFIISSRLLKK